MVKDYEDFKKFVLGLTGIDLNAYKEKQMRRRIDTLITKNNKMMAFLNIEDLYGAVEIVVFPNIYDRYSSVMTVIAMR